MNERVHAIRPIHHENMRVSTGIEGLDYVLNGGFLPGRSYLIQGSPGTGKTTLGLQFLLAGEGALLITFAQSAAHLPTDAASLGLNLDRVKVLDLTAPPELFAQVQTYDIFSPAEVEREPISQQMATTIHEVNPQRIFVDGFAHFGNLVSDAFHRRRLIQSFFRFATQRGATLVVGSEDADSERDVDGAIHLDFAPEGRSIRVMKFRGSDFHAGRFPMRLTATGLQVFPSAA